MVNVIGYTVVILICVVVLYAMFAVVRVSMSDSDKHGFLKDLLDIVVDMQRKSPPTDNAGGKPAAIPDDAAPFEEECPACSAKVTHRDAECPSCGLRLID